MDNDEDIAQKTGHQTKETFENAEKKAPKFVPKSVKKCRHKIEQTFCCKRLSDSYFGKGVVAWYKGIYSGAPLLVLSICNIYCIPQINYFAATGNLSGIKSVVIAQLVINAIYLIDWLTMAAIFGLEAVFFKKSWAFKAEPLLVVWIQFALRKVNLFGKIDSNTVLVTVDENNQPDLSQGLVLI